MWRRRAGRCSSWRSRTPRGGSRLTRKRLGSGFSRGESRASRGPTPSATAASVFYAVSTRVEELGKERVHPVFLLDEAHLLHQDVLDHLHILLNYQWDSRALLSLVLVGLPELENQLERRRNRSLYSRIHHRYAIPDASCDDVAQYVAHRLALAGTDHSLFAQDAIALIHENAIGALRDIDRLAHGAMRDAARRKRKAVDRDAVERVLAGRIPIN